MTPGQAVSSAGRDVILMEAGRTDFAFFERIIEAVYRELLAEGDVAVDGGAHEGIHTLPMARLVGPTGRVVAIEPVPRSLEILRDKLGREGLENVDIVERAVADEAGPGAFTVVTNAPARSGIREVPYPFDVQLERIEVERIRLDDLLAQRRQWRFGKFDLEGGEYHAFLGGTAVIPRLRPVLVFERGLGSPAWYGYEPDDFLRLFHSFGYAMFDLFGRSIDDLDAWVVPGRPWYAIGVDRAGPDRAFVTERLPSILDAFAEDRRANS
jgi:FkbM family methyltransferase